jgi:plasmid stabilization system protein ParE
MRVTLGLSALRDITSIGEDLLNASPQAANAFSEEIENIRERLTTFPDSGSPIEGTKVRFVVMSGFEYKLFYRPVSRDELRIMRVRHGRRRPLRIES